MKNIKWGILLLVVLIVEACVNKQKKDTGMMP